MDLVSLTIGLPLAPLRGVLAIARLIQEEVDRQLYDPAAVRRQLEEIDRARRDNELPPEEAAEAERKVVGRLTASQGG